MLEKEGVKCGVAGRYRRGELGVGWWLLWMTFYINWIS